MSRHASKDATAPAACREVPATARVSTCDVMADARLAATAVLTLALAHRKRDWLAEQLGRASSLVRRWFVGGEAERHPVPLALLVARRADGLGFVLDDEDLQRVFDELERYRKSVEEGS